MKHGRLLQVTTADGLYLHGYYSPAVVKKTAVLYIHGMNGNFYELDFVQVLADFFEINRVGFLVGNNRGNGKDTDFKTVDGKLRRIGSRYELIEEANLDISAWIKVLIDEGYQEIILLGHSAGTIKAVRYLFEGELADKVTKLILLAPIDPLGGRLAHGRNDIEKFLEKARAKIDAGKGEELIMPEFDHDILSYQSFSSWYRRDDLGRMFEFCAPDYDFPVLKKIKIATLIITGSRDEYFNPSNLKTREEAMKILLKNIPISKGKIIEGSGHCFEGFEKEIVKAITKFIFESYEPKI